MSKITRQNFEAITGYVSDCTIWRMTADETAQYLATKGFHMDVRTVKRYRAKIKLDASKWISELARSKRNDYIYQYRERIGELRTLSKRIVEYYS